MGGGVAVLAEDSLGVSDKGALLGVGGGGLSGGAGGKGFFREGRLFAKRGFFGERGFSGIFWAAGCFGALPLPVGGRGVDGRGERGCRPCSPTTSPSGAGADLSPANRGVWFRSWRPGILYAAPNRSR